MTNHKSKKRRWIQRRMMGRAAFVLLIAMLVARTLLFALDYVGIALIDLLGANILAVLYASFFMLFGWKVRGWTDSAKRRKRKASKSTAQAPAYAGQPTVLHFQASAPTPMAPLRRAEP